MRYRAILLKASGLTFKEVGEQNGNDAYISKLPDEAV